MLLLIILIMVVPFIVTLIAGMDGEGEKIDKKGCGW